MKGFFPSIVFLSIALLYSCGEQQEPDPPEPPKEVPIVGTYWTTESTTGDTYELKFTASTAAYIFKGSNGYTWIDECPYTYNPPTITMKVEWIDNQIQLKGSVVDDDDLMIKLVKSYDPLDTLRAVEFKKQDPKEDAPPTEPTIVGEWKLTHQGTIIDGIPNMEPYNGMEKYTLKYTFKNDGAGWAYYSNDHQESFKWRPLPDDQLELTNWELETDVLIDPVHEMGKEWTVQELTPTQLTVSYWMYSVPFPDDPPYHAIMAFERVNLFKNQ